MEKISQLHFECDYSRGAHPDVIRALVDSNMEVSPGYGLDPYCDEARRLILEECGLDCGLVAFMVGGTQTNATVIDALLRQWQGVVCAEEGHINVHEAGAIEASGHKVIALPAFDGKLTSEALRSYLESYYADETHEHIVEPGAVYISQPTELGTLYSLDELTRLSEVCREYSIPLFADGARLIYALAAPDSDVGLRDMARLCDVFYIGGTKAGLLFGEAVVCPSEELLPHFFSQMKRHGALLAKGRLLGVQFKALFESGLYREIGSNGISTASRLREGLLALGLEETIASPTNQLFFHLPNELIDAISPSVGFSLWGPRGESSSTVRFVTDWSTTEADVDALISLIASKASAANPPT